MQVAKLKYLNLKQKLPKVLFYKQPLKSIMRPPQEVFIAFSTTGDKNYGVLVLHKSTMLHRDDYAGTSLAIDYIESKNKRSGLGKAMIDFAKNYSKCNDCNGYIVLRADNSIDKSCVPHVFYRKQEFTTLDRKIDKKLDSFIKDNKSATSDYFSTQLMYYPAQQKHSFVKKCIDTITLKLQNYLNR